MPPIQFSTPCFIVTVSCIESDVLGGETCEVAHVVTILRLALGEHLLQVCGNLSSFFAGFFVSHLFISYLVNTMCVEYSRGQWTSCSLWSVTFLGDRCSHIEYSPTPLDIRVTTIFAASTVSLSLFISPCLLRYCYCYYNCHFEPTFQLNQEYHFNSKVMIEAVIHCSPKLKPSGPENIKLLQKSEKL